MKYNQKYNITFIIVLLTMACIFSADLLFAQNAIMPLGNSVTWGVQNRAAPPAGTHGYRQYLLNELAGLGAELTGPQTGPYADYVGNGIAPGEIDAGYLGFYINGARLTEFMEDSTYDAIDMLNTMYSNGEDLPNYIIMHLGTNDMFTVRDIGDAGTPGTVIYSLNSIVTNLLNFNTGGHSIEKLYLCKIIPMSPVADFPVENSRISDYNAQIDEMVSTYSTLNQSRIQLVNMHAAFYANQTTYYSRDLDNTHPNDAGYEAMAQILGNYLKKELRPSITDEFDRVTFGTGEGGDDWYVYTPLHPFHIENQGENNGGALAIDGALGSTSWQTTAIWSETKGKNTVSVKFHENTTADFIGRVALLVGVNVNSLNNINEANGYMVWISGNTTRVWDVENGVANTAVTTSTIIPAYNPGDELKVRFVQTSTQNEFYLTINNETYKLRDTEKRQSSLDDNISASDLYSGLIFRDDAWDSSPSPDQGVMIDNFIAENALQDVTPPSRISDFRVFSTTSSTVNLAWTATGDDANEGTAATYEIRYATSSFSEADFNTASLVPNVPAPNESGTPESFTITGLPAGVRFYFRIRAIDTWGNASAPSDIADGKTEVQGEIVETFETDSQDQYAPLSDDWVYDIDSGYRINTDNAANDEYEMVNIENDGAWDLPAIYKGRTNPSTVKIVWGDNVVNPSTGRENGGIVVMANDDDPTADGYLILVRTADTDAGKIYLYFMENGGAAASTGSFTKIDEVRYTLPSYPEANDTLAVVMDWTATDSHNKFDVYVNGTPACSRSLYDDFDHNDDGTKEAVFQPATHYAGILLTRLHEVVGRYNGVNSFITSGKYTGAGEIVALNASTTFADTAGTILRDVTGEVDSLRIKVTDENGAPASNVPVFFNVTEGGGSVSAPQAADNHIRLEAEWGVVDGTMQVTTEATASGQKYVVSPGRGDRLGNVKLDFSVNSSGTYYFWARTKATYWTNYVARFELEAKSEAGGFVWNVLNQTQGSSSWAWSRVYKGSDYQNPWTAVLNADQVYTMRVYSVHNDVPFDKFVITTDPSYIPSSTEPVETLFTDADGIASTAWTLGTVTDNPTTTQTNEGINTVVAKALGTTSIITFTAEALPDVPVRMTRTNDEQSGYARDTLSVPLIVNLFDQYDNLADNASAERDINVQFRVVRGSGDALLYTTGGLAETTKDTVTNEKGQASMNMILGIQDSIFTVEASLPDFPDVPAVVFTAYVTGGLVKEYNNLSTNEKLKVSTDPDDPDEYDVLAVKVIAEDGTNVVGAGIRFDILNGPNGTVLDAVNKLTYVVSKTDANGIARASIFPGIEAGIIDVTVNIVGVVDTVLSDSIYYRAERLEYYANNNQKGPINGTLPHALKAIVYDNEEPGHGRVVPNHPVRFQINTDVADDFSLLYNNKEQLTVIDTTDINGVAEVNVKLGAVHGYYENMVQATSSNGFDAIPAFVQGEAVDTLEFSMYATSSASLLKRIQGDSSGITTERIDTALVVQMLDRDGEPVALQPVEFRILQGGGHFEGYSTDVAVLTVMTTGDGFASVFYVLGPEPGQNNNIIQASATNGYTPLWYEYAQGSQGRQPIQFKITSRSTDAETIGVYIASDTSRQVIQNQQVIGIAGRELTTPIRVKAFDTNHYGVAGVGLQYTIANEDGGLVKTENGEWTTSLIDTTVTAEGISTVYWQLGPKTGIHNNVLEVTPVSVLPPLVGNIVRFEAITLPDSVNAVTSTIDADSTTMASSNDTCHITVTLRDKHNNVVSGRRVRLAVKNGTNNFLFQPLDTTDANGQATGSLQSLSSGPKIITAKDITETSNPITLIQEKTVIFTSNAAQKMTAYTSNSLTGNVNSVLHDSVAVLITDKYGNPVGYGPVRFEISSGGGKIWDANAKVFRNSLDVYSNGEGIASVFWALGSQTGQNTLKASSSTALEGSPLYFTATGQIGEAQRMYSISENNVVGDAGELLPDPFTVGVLDNYGHAIAGVTITFAVVDGSGTLSTTQATSDAWGHASTYLRLPEQAGLTTRVEAKGNNLAGSPQRFNATSKAGDATKIMFASSNSGNGQSGYVGETGSPLRILVTDAHGNPVSNVEVTFKKLSKADGGELTLNGGQTTTDKTDASGIAQVTPVFGNKTGLVTVEATSPYLEGSPVKFSLTILPNQAADIVLFPEEKDYQKVTVGQYMVDPLMVRVVDEHNNPVPGAGIFFEKKSDTGGGSSLWDKRNGSIQGNQAVQSDADGIAAIQLKAGPSPSTIKVHALWGQDKVIEFTVESVINPNSPTLNRSILQTSYDVHEKTELLIPLGATADGDGDPITFEIANRFPPDGATIPNPNDNPAVLRWTPSQDQAGQYELALRVVDGRGGFDQDTVTVNVVNVNRPPVIDDWEPTTDETVVCGAEIRYWVAANDPDNDDLTYSWELEGVPVGSNSQVLNTYAPNNNGRYTVDVYVSDGVVHVSHRWILEVNCSSVEMTEFFASFDLDKPGIDLEWETEKEINNLGFDVFRSYSETEEFSKITEELIPSQMEGTYSYKDDGILAGKTYYYKLMDMDAYGNRKEYGPVAVEIPIPKELNLSQNYPNPFNPTTRIRYQVPSYDHIQLTIYNMMGQEVVKLVNEKQQPGYYTAQWNGCNSNGQAVSTGLYIYRIQSSKKAYTKRMIKLK